MRNDCYKVREEVGGYNITFIYLCL